MVYLLPEDELIFPEPYAGEEDGLIAVGGDLSTDRLLLAYSNGIFPWFAFRDSKFPYWYCPLDRFVIFPEEIHISHSMRQLIKKGRYQVTFNKDFNGVIRGCSEVNLRMEKKGAWLGEDMIAAYTELHRLGYAASVEVWENDVLVGGLYGVTIGNAFCGESMFSNVPDASKLALIYLAQRLQGLGMLIDCQFETPHLLSMGGRHIPYPKYMAVLKGKSA
ncbi:MAG: leucyl/phenylalanyl-tRNA--protein transferase [Bacteroides sp.]|nr:leucyl/phenylalanyl-tRNA--protein transferase [Bacteroides sp.]